MNGKKKSAAKKSPAKKSAAKKLLKKKSVKAKPAAKKVAKKKPAKKAVKKVSKSKPKPPSKSKPKSAVKAKPKVKAKAVAKVKAKAKPVVTRKKRVKQVESPALVQIKIFQEEVIVRDYGFPDHAPELPDAYLRDRLVLMTQTPDYLFCYWEITPAKLLSLQGMKSPGGEYREALRLNWSARSLLDENFAIIPVNLSARRWYLKVPFPGLSYQVEIGWMGESGNFISILASNVSDAPESWEETLRRLQSAGDVLAYASRIAHPPGSSSS
jgi:hypothetical protein